MGERFQLVQSVLHTFGIYFSVSSSEWNSRVFFIIAFFLSFIHSIYWNYSTPIVCTRSHEEKCKFTIVICQERKRSILILFACFKLAQDQTAQGSGSWERTQMTVTRVHVEQMEQSTVPLTSVVSSTMLDWYYFSAFSKQLRFQSKIMLFQTEVYRKLILVSQKTILSSSP